MQCSKKRIKEEGEWNFKEFEGNWRKSYLLSLNSNETNNTTNKAASNASNNAFSFTGY